MKLLGACTCVHVSPPRYDGCVSRFAKDNDKPAQPVALQRRVGRVRASSAHGVHQVLNYPSLVASPRTYCLAHTEFFV